MEVAEVTIQENDDPRGVLQFNVSQDVSGPVLAYEMPPPGNLLRLPVVRLAGSTGRVVVYWEALPITASLDDFSPISGNLTFQVGQVSHLLSPHLLNSSRSIVALESRL